MFEMTAPVVAGFNELLRKGKINVLTCVQMTPDYFIMCLWYLAAGLYRRRIQLHYRGGLAPSGPIRLRAFILKNAGAIDSSYSNFERLSGILISRDAL